MLKRAPVHPLELISARMDREITPGEARFLEAHLEKCSACQQKEAELKAITSDLAALSIPVLPTEATERLLLRIREQEDAMPPAATNPMPAVARDDARVETRPRHGAPWRALVLAAATALIVLFVAFGMPADRPRVQGAVSIPSLVVPAAPGITSLGDAGIRPALALDGQRSRPPLPVAALDGQRSRPPLPVVALERPAEPEGTQPTTTPTPSQNFARGGTDVALQPIPFKGNGKRLTREARQLVESVAEFLRQHRDVKLVIQGHTGEQRSVEKDLALGHKRALAVARQLESLGIDASRLRAEPGAAGDRGNRVEFTVER